MVYVLGFYIPLTDLLIIFLGFISFILVAVLIEIRKMRLVEKQMVSIEKQLVSIEKKMDSEEKALSKMVNKLKKMLKD
jgi:hypothetical protein